MWKVKRMNTARIVVHAIAVGAGGIAAYPAGGFDSKPRPPAKPVAQLQILDVLRAGRAQNPDRIGADIINSEIILSNMRALRRGEGVSIARYGLDSPMAMQK
jgi:hypothetical protein